MTGKEFFVAHIIAVETVAILLAPLRLYRNIAYTATKKMLLKTDHLHRFVSTVLLNCY